MDFDEIISASGNQTRSYAELAEKFSEAEFRGEIEMIGWKVSRGSFLANFVLSACAAYRIQLFMYLKSCGRGRVEHRESLGRHGCAGTG